MQDLIKSPKFFLGERFCELPDGSSYPTDDGFWPEGVKCGMKCQEGYLVRSYGLES